MKHIRVHTKKHHNQPDGPNIFVGANICSTKELWTIQVDCLDKEQDRELDKIVILMPAGQSFSGTIQDLMAIPAIISNAQGELQKVAAGGVDATYHDDILHSIEELKHLLSLFKKG